MVYLSPSPDSKHTLASGRQLPTYLLMNFKYHEINYVPLPYVRLYESSASRAFTNRLHYIAEVLGQHPALLHCPSNPSRSLGN